MVSRYTEGELYYDDRQGRWCINGYELHCGESLDVWRNGKWETVLIDFNQTTKQFYTTPHIQLERHLHVRHKLC